MARPLDARTSRLIDAEVSVREDENADRHRRMIAQKRGEGAAPARPATAPRST